MPQHQQGDTTKSNNPEKARKNFWANLKQDQLYTKSYDEFVKQFSDPDARKKLHENLQKDRLYTKGYEDFNQQFFADLKKKEPSYDIGGLLKEVPTGPLGGSGDGSTSLSKRREQLLPLIQQQTNFSGDAQTFEDTYDTEQKIETLYSNLKDLGVVQEQGMSEEEALQNFKQNYFQDVVGEPEPPPDTPDQVVERWKENLDTVAQDETVQKVPGEPPEKLSEDFSFTEDFKKRMQNLWPNLKREAGEMSQYVANIQDKIYRGAEAIGLDVSGLRAVNTANMVQSMAVADEASKDIQPVQPITDAFASGDPEKIASSVVGAVVSMSESLIKSVATGGAYMYSAPIANNYVETLEQTAAQQGKTPYSIFLKDEDKELIPTITGTIHGSLEKIGIDKVTKNILSKAPLGVWKKIVDVAATSKVEGTTEALQSVVDQVGQSMANGNSVDSAWKEVLEEGLMGFFGAGGLTTTAQLIKQGGKRDTQDQQGMDGGQQGGQASQQQRPVQTTGQEEASSDRVFQAEEVEGQTPSVGQSLIPIERAQQQRREQQTGGQPSRIPKGRRLEEGPIEPEIIPPLKPKQSQKIPYDPEALQSDEPSKERQSNLRGEARQPQPAPGRDMISEEYRNYRPISNEKAEKEAQRVLDKYGREAVEEVFLDEATDLNDVFHTAMGYKLIESYENESNWSKAEYISNQLAKARTAAGQLLQAGRIFSRLSGNTIRNSVNKGFRESGKQPTEEQSSRIDELIDKIKRAPEGTRKAQAFDDLFSYVKNIQGYSVREIGWSIWYAHILSGLSTQQINSTANFARLFLETGVTAIQSLVETKNPRAMMYILAGLREGFTKGALDAKRTLTTQYSPIRGFKYEGRGRGLEYLKDSKKWFRFFHNWKWVRRVMEGADALVYDANKGLRQRQLAIRMAQKENGFVTKTMMDEAHNILNNTKEKYKKAQQQAKQEKEDAIAEIKADKTWTDKEKQDRIKNEEKLERLRTLEIIEQQRPSDIVDDANEFGARGTYNYPPEGFMGDVARAISRQVSNMEVARFVVPFTNVIANVANDYMDWTPYGYYRLIKGGIGHKSGIFGHNFRKYSTEEKARTALKASSGLLSMVMLYILSDDEDGLFYVTGRGTGDFRKNYELERQGWQPYSIKIGDTWISYQNTPFAVAFAAAGNYRDAQRYQPEGTQEDHLLSTLGNSMFYIFDLSFVTSLTDFFAVLSDDSTEKPVGERAADFMKRSAKSFYWPNLMTQLNRSYLEVTDKAMKDAPGLFDYMARDTPVGGYLNDLVNSLGEPVTPTQTRKYIPFQVQFAKDPEEKELADKIWDLVVDHQAWIGFPRPTPIFDFETGEDREMTDDEYYFYKRRSGEYTMQLLKIAYNGLTSIENKDIVRNIITGLKRKARLIARMELSIQDRETLNERWKPEQVVEETIQENTNLNTGE